MAGHASTAETARHLDTSRTRRLGTAIEIVESLLLAVVAVTTAWTSYQATLWDTRSASSFGQASQLGIKAQSASTLAGQQMLYDASAFTAWLTATQSGNADLAAFLERRFRPEYRPAFQAWLATDPLHNPSAPAGPGEMPEYRNASADRAAQLEREAGAALDGGNRSRHVADEYVKTTVLLAVVLFLTALSQHFAIRRVRIGIVSLAVVALCYAMGSLVTIGA